MKTTAALLCSLLAATAAFGQISITETDFQALLDMQRTEVAYLTTDLSAGVALRDMTGPGQTWNVTGVPFEVRDTTTIDFLSSVAGTIGQNEPAFSTANVVLTFQELDEGLDVQSAVYYNLSSTGFTALGSIAIGEFIQTGVADTITSVNDPPEALVTFPFTFGTVISDSVTTSVFAADTLVITTATVTEGEVDGWGTLVSAWGSMDVVRYRVERTSYFLGALDETEVLIEWWGPQGPVMDIELDEADNVVDMTYFDISVSERPVGVAEVADTGGFGLRSAYPNPFTGSTTIRFTTPTASHVRVVVYDLIGRQIAILKDAYQPAGDGVAHFDAAGLPDGVYFVRLIADQLNDVRAVTLAK